MCWISNNKPEQLIAKEDITVYKVIQKYPDDKILSYFNDFPYELGEIYNTTITVRHFKDDYNNFYFIKSGFHSYNYDLEICIDPFITTPVLTDALETRYYGTGVYGMICTIPKGTKYYVNEFGDVVSTSIKPIALSTKELNNLKEGEHFEYDTNYLFDRSYTSYNS
jgi:hypothetical protein